MAKLTILAAALTALLALGSVTAFRTITTTVVEEGNPGQSQERCREQIQQQQQLRHCQTYLSQQGRRSYVAMITDRNPQEEQQLRQCCEQLEQLDEECRCEGLRTAVRQQQQQQQGEQRGEQMREVMQKAESLPSRCNLSPRQCQISSVWF